MNKDKVTIQGTVAFAPVGPGGQAITIVTSRNDNFTLPVPEWTDIERGDKVEITITKKN